MARLGQSEIQARPAQEVMIAEVSAAIEGKEHRLIQASTGTGKTLAYLEPALRSGLSTVVSVPTRQLQKQVLSQVELLGGQAVMRLGMANFFSKSRINRLIVEIQERKPYDEELVAYLQLARDWPSTVEEFVDEYGDLPIDRSLVCLNSRCPSSDREHYQRLRLDADGANFVIQTHALTLLELRFGRHSADITIFDEAHSLPSLAASAVEARIPLAEIGLSHLSERLSSANVVPLDEEILAEVRAAREEVEDDELKLALARILAPLKSLKHGVGLVAAPVPSLQRVALDPARFVGRNLKGKTALFISATLDPVSQFRNAVGLDECQQRDIVVSKFGSMRISLADRKVPPPFSEGSPNSEFFDYAASMVRATTGRTLVLASSYDDVEQIGSRVDGLILHHRGEPLGRYLAEFQAKGGKLVTPAAWEGLDLPHFIEDLVIVRFPLAPTSELRQSVLEKILDARGFSRSSAKNIMQAQARSDAIRRMAQGVGRGIRAPDDQVRLRIADPRFPLAAAVVRDPRKMLSQGAAVGFLDFASTIPARFREGWQSPYNQAAIFPWARERK